MEVHRVAAELRERYASLDVLVNNAGVMRMRRELTVDGYERNFAVNHLAPFALTNALLERLSAAAPARIVMVGSAAYKIGRIDFDDLDGARRFGGFKAYAQSKLANLLFVHAPLRSGSTRRRSRSTCCTLGS